jgi:uncharacterized phage protein (TIGR01671 family)
MNDRFKFRAYYKPLNRVFDIAWFTSTTCMFSDGTEPANPDYITLMQCTGFKDDDNKLIYEGDILRANYIEGQLNLFKNEYEQELEDKIFKVYCSEHSGNYFCECIEPDWYTPELYRMICINRDTGKRFIKIIGNIYENRELLEVGNEN